MPADMDLWISHHQKLPTTSTGGVGHSIAISNPSAQPYRQLDLVFIPYDRFGRRQSSDIDNVDEVLISLSEPLMAGASVTKTWPDIWFSQQISCVELDRLRIVRADGSVQIFRQAEIETLLAPGVGNNCRQ